MTDKLPYEIVEPVIHQPTSFEEPLSLLLYGEAGTGKTFFAGSLGDRSLVCNLGWGLKTWSGPNFINKHGVIHPLRIDIPIDNPHSFDILYDSLESAMKLHGDKFDAVIVDEITALRRHAMNKAAEINHDLNKYGKSPYDSYDKIKDIGYVVPQIMDYGEEMRAVEDFLIKYIELCKTAGKHFLALAHERHDEKKVKGTLNESVTTAIYPGFTGQTFPSDCTRFFDEVWRLTVVGIDKARTYQFQTEPDALVVAKTRHGGVFAEIEKNLDFPTVIKRIKGYKYIPDPKAPKDAPDKLIAVKV